MSLSRRQLAYLQEHAASMNDKAIASALRVDAREVRKARRRLGLPEAAPRPARRPEPAAGGAASAVAEAGAVAAPSPERIAAWLDHPAVGVVLLAAFLVVVGWQGMLPVRNPDFGWHVALGRWMVEHGAIPATEPFTHTAVGKPVVMPEWLSEVFYWLVERAGGVMALRWVHAVAIVLIVALVFVLLRRRRVPTGWALLGTLVYVAVAQTRFQQRPLLFDLLMLVAMYGYVFVVRPRLQPRELVGIAIATVVWANLHPGMTLFATIVVLYVAVEALQQWTGWRRPEPDDLGGGDLRRLALLAAVVSLAVFATPNHVRLLPYVLETNEMNAGQSLEWLPVTRLWGHPTMTPYAVESYCLVLAATLVTAVVLVRRRSLAELAVVLFLAVLPLRGQRFVAVEFAPIVFVLGAVGDWTRRAGGVARRVASAAALGIAVAGAYPVLNNANELHRYGDRLSPAWNFQVATYPIGAVRFLGEVPLTGKLFNISDWGGYLLHERYTQYPIFIDGRWVEVGKQVFDDSQTITNLRPETWSTLDRYDIDLLLVPREWMPKSLVAQHRWIPAFENFNAGIYVRNTPRNAENLRALEAYYARFGIPFSPETGFDEHRAFDANRTWAADFRVERQHLKSRTGGLAPGW